MNAIELDLTVDEEVAKAVPGLRPLLGHKVAITAVSVVKRPEAPRLTVDEFFSQRSPRPAEIASVTVDDMDRAVAAGARRRADV